MVTTRTSFSNPSLADGRDLLQHILPHIGNDSWRPSMNLSELIKQIPNFVHDVVTKQRAENNMVGQFHLGQQYEISTWINNKRCGVYPCELERENIYYEEDKETGAKTLKKVRTVRVNIYLVVTETILLVLETDQTLKNVAKLTSWATLSALEKIRHKLEPDDYIQFFWRRLPG